MTKRNIPIGSVLLWVAVGLAFLTVISLFASLGDGGGGNAGITKRPTTTTTTATVTTASPVTTVAPVTTVPPVTTTPPVELTPGQELALSMYPAVFDGDGRSMSHKTDDGFYLKGGHSGGSIVPINAPENGIYSITFEVVEFYASDNFLAYIRNGVANPGEGFVTENFWGSATSLQLHLALHEGMNEVFLWLDYVSLTITSVTYEKVADYDTAIADFTGSGTGALVLYSGNPRLDYLDGTDVSNTVIRSDRFTVTESGEYDLSFIAGSKCIPVVRILDSTGAVVQTVDWGVTWNDYGVDPLYNNQSTVYIPPRTVELEAGEYTIEVAFGDDKEHQDAILVHSAYLTKK